MSGEAGEPTWQTPLKGCEGVYNPPKKGETNKNEKRTFEKDRIGESQKSGKANRGHHRV